MDWFKGRNYFWKNKPASFGQEQGLLTLVTEPCTDFWQRTHYGFSHDSGHCLLTVAEGDFVMTCAMEFAYRQRFDQCGVILYHSPETWMKGSIEREDKQISRLGSVVTNFGYSDWASSDVSSAIHSVSYRLHRSGDDFLLEQSQNGLWSQMRIFRLHGVDRRISVGIYACSPLDSSFTARFSQPIFA